LSTTPKASSVNSPERIDRAVAARAVLENPAYQEAVSKITQDIRSLRLSLGPRDTEGAYRLVLMEQAVEKAKRLMEAYLQDGEAARKELDKSELPGPVGRLNRRFQQLTR
jgi:hypothetical protein